MSRICLLDLDGVLCDFVGAAKRINQRLADNLDKDFCTLTTDEWASCGYDFWEGLEWTADGRSLFYKVESHFGPDNLYICTSPCATDGGLEGKRAWVRKHLGYAYQTRTVFTSHKYLLANPRHVLVDDLEHNVDPFRGAGGLAVLVPRPWNRLRHEVPHYGRDDFERDLRDPH